MHYRRGKKVRHTVGSEKRTSDVTVRIKTRSDRDKSIETKAKDFDQVYAHI